MASNHDSRCKARAKSGKSCQAAATAGGVCLFHANPNEVSELGRIGGRKTHSGPPEPCVPLPKLESAIAVRDAISQLLADVHAGNFAPKIAAGLAPFLTLQLQAIKLTYQERRLKDLDEYFENMRLRRITNDPTRGPAV